MPVNTLADVIECKRANADRELQFFGQELMELAEAEIFDEATYLAALADGPRVGGAEGIDATLAADNLDCIVAPTNSPAWPTDLINGDAFLFGSSGLTAVAGYPPRHGDRRIHVRIACRPDVHGLRVERTDADRGRLGL